MKCIAEYIEKIDELCIELKLSTLSKPREISFLQEYCKVIY